MDDRKTINCPLCGQITDRIRYRVDAAYSAAHMFHYTGSQEDADRLTTIIKDLWGKESSAFMECENRGLAFADPFLAGNSAFYSAVYQDDVFYPAWKWDYEITFQDLSQVIKGSHPSEVGLLEIGAGNGAFIKRLSEAIFKKENMVCKEYSDFGADEIRKMGITCISDNIITLDTASNHVRFGFICMFQVLEHMENLEGLFETLNAITMPGATLYITVPADKYRAFYDRLGTFMDTPPNHVSRWNHQSFSRLGSHFGWNIDQYAIQPMRYQEKLKKFIFNRLEHHHLFRNIISGGKQASFIQKAGLLLAFGIIALLYLRSVIALKDPGLGISQWIKMNKDS